MNIAVKNAVGVLAQLQHHIAQGDAIGGFLDVAAHFSGGQCSQDYRQRLIDLARPRDISLNYQNESEHFRQFCRYFYHQLAFTKGEGDMFQSKYSLIHQVLDYRTGVPLSLAVLFCYLGQQEGLNLTGVNFPGHFLVKFTAKGGSQRYIDPMTGEELARQDLEEMYFSVMGDDDDGFSDEALAEADTEVLILRMLRNLKAAYMEEGQVEKAFQCVELLVGLCPDDPYERRDRGFLLQRMDCAEIAEADYRYYIKHCPKDPAAQLLKIQLRHLEPRSQVLH